MQEKIVQGFSKLSKEEKVDWVVKNYFSSSGDTASGVKEELRKFWISEEGLQRTFDNFSENTISNFNLPFGVAP
ncbi:MAG: hydroxymethylglutaryl-CoA reductase, partial [Bacteroidetes bacterium]